MTYESDLVRREEDDMLQFAHVPRHVCKCYAVRYRGRPSDLPYFFARFIEGYSEGIRLTGRHDTISLKTRHGFAECQNGDWIVIKPDLEISGKLLLCVYTDEDFLKGYMHVRDLSYD